MIDECACNDKTKCGCGTKYMYLYYSFMAMELITEKDKLLFQTMNKMKHISIRPCSD